MMRLAEARKIVDGEMPLSIERALKLLRRSGCDVDGLGRVVLQGDDGLHAYAIKADPLSKAGMDFIMEDER